MKTYIFFIKTTIKGGILFFLPLVFLYMIFEKIESVFSSLITPVAEKLGINNFAGKASITILIVLTVFAICFLGGLLMRMTVFKNISEALDEKLSKVLPGYKKMKTKTLEKLDAVNENKHTA